MVRYDAHGDIAFFLSSVRNTGHLAYLTQHGLEHIGIVVRGLTLNGTYQTLKAHTGINDLHG